MRGKAKRVARPAQTRLPNSVVAEPKFTKFLSDVDESWAALMRTSMLRSCLPLWNASAQNEGEGLKGYAKKRKIGYHSNVPCRGGSSY